jgi:hypothetical protein
VDKLEYNPKFSLPGKLAGKAAFVGSLLPQSHALVIYDTSAERDSLIHKFVCSRLEYGEQIEAISVEPRRVTNVLNKTKKTRRAMQKKKVRVSGAKQLYETGGNPYDSFVNFFNDMIRESQSRQKGCSFTDDTPHLFYEQFQKQIEIETFVENRSPRPTTLCLYKREGFTKLGFNDMTFLFQSHDSIMVNSTLFVRQLPRTASSDF